MEAAERLLISCSVAFYMGDEFEEGCTLQPGCALPGLTAESKSRVIYRLNTI